MPTAEPVIVSVPTVTIYGCGGFGINIARSVTNYHGIDSQIVRTKYLDTSKGNIRPGEELTLFGDGDGSGTVRTTHLEDIKTTIAGYSAEQAGISDVNIIITALAGGSGTVIGPSLVKLIHEHDKRIIVVGVGDARSQTQADNTAGTLENLVDIADREGIYLPTMLYNNMAADRNAVDKGVVAQIIHLIHTITAPTVEVDRRDRINFLDGILTVDASPGLRTLHVIGSEDFYDGRPYTGELWSFSDKHVFDAVLKLGCVIDTGVNHVDINPLCRFHKEGVYLRTKITPTIAMISSDAAGVSKLVDAVNQAARTYSSAPPTSSLSSTVGGLKRTTQNKVKL